MGAQVRQAREQVVHLRAVDISLSGRDLSPFLFLVICRVDLLKGDGLAVPRHVQPGRVEGAEREQIFLSVLDRCLAQLGDQRRIDGEDQRPRDIPSVERARGRLLAY